MGTFAYAPNLEKAGEVDRDLVRRSLAGEQDAFAEIVRNHQRRVYAVALRMTRRHEVADDIAQETFIRAYRSLSRFELGRPLAPWLTRIAVNLAINHLKGPASREQALYTEDSPEGPPKLQEILDGGNETEDPMRRLQTKEFARAFARALERLSPDHRAVLVLKVDEGMRYEEIAATLGISTGTVMSRLFRARARLKSMLEAYL